MDVWRLVLCYVFALDSMILQSINMTQVPPSLYVYGIFHLPVENCKSDSIEKAISHLSSTIHII